jgi:hypothetical protein
MISSSPPRRKPGRAHTGAFGKLGKLGGLADLNDEGGVIQDDIADGVFFDPPMVPERPSMTWKRPASGSVMDGPDTVVPQAAPHVAGPKASAKIACLKCTPR